MDSEVRITLRLPAELRDRLAARARADRRSLNSEIVHLLEGVLADPAEGADSP